MMSTYRKFSRLLEIEIESLHDELEALLETLDRRLAKHEITEYVRNENYAFLKNELMGLEDFLKNRLGPPPPATDGCPDGQDPSVEEIAEETLQFVRERMLERGYVPALYELISRRVERIVAYLQMPCAEL